MRILVNAIEWSGLRSALGPSSDFLPGALLRLAGSCSAEEARSAYWELDNRIVVQGELYQAAVPAVAPLLSALVGDLSIFARRAIVALLLELVMGRPSEVETGQGNDQVAERVRMSMLSGLWIFYGLLDREEDDFVSVDCIDILDEIEEDRSRFEKMLLQVAASSGLPKSRMHAASILDREQ